MLRRFARQTLTRCVTMLPNNTRRAVMETLSEGPDGWLLFQALGRKYKVRDICMLGGSGYIQGTLSDEGVMARYATQQSYPFGEANRLFVDFFAQHSKAGTYIDIGANLGLSVIPLATRLPNVSCIAIEPNPDNFRHLTRNVAMHCPDDNVQLLNIAIGDQTGMVDFEVDEINPGDSRIHTVGAGALREEMRPVIRIAAKRLDDVFGPNTPLTQPLVIKMDVQGAEGLAFAGAESLFARCAILYFQYWPYAMRRFGSQLEPMVNFIAKTFTSGSLVPGDMNVAPTWQPVAQVVEEMQQQWQRKDEPFIYHEVYLRRS